ncbi:MAG: copper resistance CopC/CopD family protein [Gaiellaceae bacterium]
MTRRLVVSGVLLGVALLAPGGASAHVVLLSATPGAQSSLAAAPTQILLRFTEPVAISPSAIRVLGADGTVLSRAARAANGDLVVIAPVSGLARGSAYTVRWRVSGQDGHSPSGVFTFGVGVPAPPPTEAVGARATSWKDDLARWALFASLALVIGPLVVRLIVLRGAIPQPLERRFHLVPTVAAFAVLNVGIAAFVLRASNALQLPLPDLLYGDLQPFAEKTRFGIAFLALTLGFGVVAILLLFAWVADRHALRAPALALSVVLASGISLSSHQATQPNSSKASELADWLHLVSAAVWVGGLITLAFLVWPSAPALRARAFLGFARLAVGLVGVMVLAGAYLALVRLPSISDLWESQYGRLLLVKLAIVALALSWGALHHFVVRPRLLAGGASRVRPSLVGETFVALAVLLMAAVLTNATPPPTKTTTTSVQLSR